MLQVRYDASRYLVDILEFVILKGGTDWKAFSLCDKGEMLRHGLKNMLIDRTVVAEHAKIFCDVEDGRLGRTVGKRRNGGVEGPAARFHRLEIAEGGEPRGTVGVKLKGYAARVCQHCRNNGAHALRRQ